MIYARCKAMDTHCQIVRNIHEGEQKKVVELAIDSIDVYGSSLHVMDLAIDVFGSSLAFNQFSLMLRNLHHFLKVY